MKVKHLFLIYHDLHFYYSFSPDKIERDFILMEEKKSVSIKVDVIEEIMVVKIKPSSY